MSKTALITGITGQDGSYLAELLLSKDYEVHGMVRRSSTFNRSRIEKFFDINTYLKGGGNGKFFLHYGDLLDSSSIGKILNKVSPTEVYNLGAQSHVGVSFDVPEYTVESTGVGTLRLLEAIKTNNINVIVKDTYRDSFSLGTRI